MPALNSVKHRAAPSPAPSGICSRSGALKCSSSSASSAPSSADTCPAKQYSSTCGASSAAFFAALHVATPSSITGTFIAAACKMPPAIAVRTISSCTSARQPKPNRPRPLSRTSSCTRAAPSSSASSSVSEVTTSATQRPPVSAASTFTGHLASIILPACSASAIEHHTSRSRLG